MTRRKTGKKTGKQAVMTSPVNGAQTPTGAHPGNTGGKKGRSGRRPFAFTLFAQDVLESPKTKKAIRTAAADPQTPGFPSLIKGLYSIGAGREGTISMEAHWRHIEQLALVIGKHVKEPDVLRAIEADAQAIRIVDR